MFLINWSLQEVTGIALRRSIGLQTNHVILMTSCLRVLHPRRICRTFTAAQNSLYEGFGLPVLEAMTCGVPVACSNISSIPEVIGDTGALFDPYDEESIADAMRRLLADSELLNDCRQRGLERSRQYTWSATATLTLKVIREAAEEGS